MARRALRQRQASERHLVAVGEESLGPGGEHRMVGGMVAVFVIVPFQAEPQGQIPPWSRGLRGIAGARHRILSAQQREQRPCTTRRQRGGDRGAAFRQRLVAAVERRHRRHRPSLTNYP